MFGYPHSLLALRSTNIKAPLELHLEERSNRRFYGAKPKRGNPWHVCVGVQGGCIPEKSRCFPARCYKLPSPSFAAVWDGLDAISDARVEDGEGSGARKVGRAAGEEEGFDGFAYCITKIK